MKLKAIETAKYLGLEHKFSKLEDYVTSSYIVWRTITLVPNFHLLVAYGRLLRETIALSNNKFSLGREKRK